MQRVVVSQSRSRWALFGLGALSFTALGLVIIRMPNGLFIGWADIIFSGVATLLCARYFFDTRPRIVIDDSGILDRTLKVGVIAWDDITDAYLRRTHGQAFICLDLQNSAKYTATLSPAMQKLVAINARIGFTDLSLNLAGTNANAEQIEALILARIQRTVTHTA